MKTNKLFNEEAEVVSHAQHGAIRNMIHDNDTIRGATSSIQHEESKQILPRLTAGKRKITVRKAGNG